MGVISTALKHLMAAGVTGDALLAAVAEIEHSQKPIKSTSATRQARYRDRNKASQSVTSVTNVTDEKKGVSLSPPSPLSPITPIPLTPSNSSPKTLPAKAGADFFEDDGRSGREYRWHGQVICLNERDYQGFNKLLAPGLYLDDILQEEDTHLATLSETSKNRKGWFFYTQGRLKQRAEQKQKLAEIGM